MLIELPFSRNFEPLLELHNNWTKVIFFSWLICMTIWEKKTVLTVRPHLHYIGEIWKRSFHSENTSNVFWSNHAGEIWKWHQMFSVHAEEKATIAVTLLIWGCVWGKLGQQNHMIIIMPSLSKTSFWKCFPSTLKLKAGVFKFPRLEGRLQKLPFFCVFQISLTSCGQSLRRRWSLSKQL